ncbi:MAG TPA: FAD-binding oxidoreductase [Rhizomicrobium sp.]|jgi:alkyldihydroxyacetonephosphate synthase|nr:FAD-binding oxidoreductase [Rhizomicrobium sp.]
MMDRKKIRWNGWGWAEHSNPLANDEKVWSWLAGELGVASLPSTPARKLEGITLPPSQLSADDRAKFVSLLGAEQVRDDNYERAFHALGRSYFDLLRLRAGDLSVAPDAVLYPRSTDDVLAILSFASDREIAVVPFGGGTSVVGGVSAARGKFKSVLTVDLSLMDKLVGVDPVARIATAQSGIYGPALDKALATQGLTLGHYPQSFEFSTLGGWIAHRGSGQQSGRYGRAENWLAGVKLATPTGLLSTDDFPASAAGPHLADLAVGSEGIFGIVTEARMHIQPVPDVRDYYGFLFRDFETGAEAVREVKQQNISTAMLRLSDAEETRFYRAFSGLGKAKGLRGDIENLFLRSRGLAGKPSVLIAGFEGSREETDAAFEKLNKITGKFSALALGKGQGQRWFEGRFHGPYMRDPMMDRGVGVDTLETATRWPNIKRLHAAVRNALETSMAATLPRGARGIVMGHISHVYRDGASLYFTYIFPRANDEIAQWRKIKTAASDAIAANGGTISHHHGVGEDHLPWIKQEKGELGIEILRAIKRTLDPKGVLNPGKLIPN